MEGWLLDIDCFEEGKITIWLKTPDGEVRSFKEKYRPVFYVYGDSEELKKLEMELREHDAVCDWNFERRRARLRDLNKSVALKLECKSSKDLFRIAHELKEIGGYRRYGIYNVDVPRPQTYLYEKDLFPFAKVRLKGIFDPDFESIDRVCDTDYDLPPLKFARMEVEAENRKLGKGFESPIKKITVGLDGERAEIVGGNDVEMIFELVNIIKETDPDVIMTSGGDSWDLPYLAKRARANDIEGELVLGRGVGKIKSGTGTGKSYSSYGRVYYKPSPCYLRGRIHIDTENSFIYQNCGFQGLVELSRTTRTPLQRTARSSIGSAMTNLQLYEARKNDVLIPWRKSEPESFKSALKLLKTDRGGLIYDPKVGVHEEVGEIDFSSFYPAIMEKHNISPETILCDCCPDSKKTVPELGYNICERRRGFIPQVLKPVLEKRRKYKKMAGEARDPRKRKIYDNRQEALKWILVTSFGYLGYRNAKFGRIEAHEAVTAFARHNLLRASRIVEKENFEVLHGIVDSLWIKKRNFEESELRSLCDRIEDTIGLPISPEGKYRWIVFSSSKDRPNVPVVNRYYGTFVDGKIKYRGVSARRSDSPEIIKRAQLGMLRKLSRARGVEEFEERIPDAFWTLEKYVNRLKRGDVKTEDIAVKKRLSKPPSSYRSWSRSASAAEQLIEAGGELHAGQQVIYIVRNTDADDPNLRVRPIQLIEGEIKYDLNWYLDRLFDAAEELFRPFGYTKENIRSKLIQKGKQRTLREVSSN